MARSDAPDIVIGRIPLYLRALMRLQLDGTKITSSNELGERLRISSAQIRKDLSHFGEFGKQGSGYDVPTLISELQRILHADRMWPVVLVGVGDLGHALVHYGGFASRGFTITHLFDKDPQKVGTVINQLVVETSDAIETTIRRSKMQVAMIATPADSAQNVANQLVRGGIHAILNYAPITIAVPPEVRVQYIDPVIHLQRMVYYLHD